jgi:7-cyano-7-deazaguanine synthase
MIPRPNRAVVLLSGGLDSLVSLAIANVEMEVRLVLFINHRQRALERERHAVMGAARFYDLPFREVDLGWLGSLAPDGMRLGASADSSLETFDSVWIPNRNGVFLNVAAAFAENYGCDWVVTGFNREEAAEFPDNRAEYVTFVNEGFELSTQNAVKIVSFIQDLDKREILERGIKVGAPLSVIWSCYKEGEMMCGRCASCRRLKVALDALSVDARPPIQFSD